MDQKAGATTRIRKKLKPFDDVELYPHTERPSKPTYLNIGAGRFRHPMWHNLDNPSEWYKELQKSLHIAHDLTSDKPFPIEDGTLQVAYTSHVIEHIPDVHVQRMFDEAYRCLADGGIFRVVAPDMEAEYDAYARGDKAYFYWRNFPRQVLPYRHSVEDIFLVHFAATLSETHKDPSGPKVSTAEIQRAFKELPMNKFFDRFCKMVDPVVQSANPQSHCNWFSVGKVMKMLKKAGFTEVYDSRFGQSKSPYLRNTLLFDNTRPTSALYVEARKTK